MYKPQKKKYCRFCRDNTLNIDYKNISLLRSFLTERVKIVPRRNSGNCAKHQRRLTIAIKRARYLALVPYTVN
ncbi:MAG: 30S ribosomal protein S18 [Candidatus Firestonebacteria bacterium]